MMRHGWVWQFTAMVIVIVGGFTYMIFGDFRAIPPLAIISGMAGGIGSLIIVLERRRARAKPPQSPDHLPEGPPC